MRVPDDLRPAVRWLGALFGAAALGALCVSVLWSPEEIATARHAALLGLAAEPCPGCDACGLSRAFSALSHFRPGEALSLNRAVAWAYPLTLLLATLGPFAALRRSSEET